MDLPPIAAGQDAALSNESTAQLDANLKGGITATGTYVGADGNMHNFSTERRDYRTALPDGSTLEYTAQQNSTVMEPNGLMQSKLTGFDMDNSESGKIAKAHQKMLACSPSS